ncbi:MAG TPA: EF-hand domain-containing protein [Gemmataceae bacterium]|jgi:Ca2+-binding EF-hand superfamily protein|nr:EF-hand domain-containing protein [Gemmataceae bacterium]
MLRIVCLLSVAGLLASAQDVAAKPKAAKGDKIEAMFKKLDTNGDGTLSREEFAKITELRKKGGEAKGKGKGVEALFNKLNTSGDGKLTLEEFRKIKELRKKKKGEDQ